MLDSPIAAPTSVESNNRMRRRRPAPGSTGRGRDRRATGHRRHRGRDRGPDGGGVVVLANPRGFCAGVDRAIDDRRASAGRSARRCTSARRSCTTSTSVENSKSKGRGVRRRNRRGPARDGVFCAHGITPAVADAAERRGLKCRRHLPAGHQGAHGGAPVRPPGDNILLVGHAGTTRSSAPSAKRPSAPSWSSPRPPRTLDLPFEQPRWPT